MARPENWRDSRWPNWRLSRSLCLRIMPGLWFPAVYWSREKRYFAVVLPFLGLTIDYDPVDLRKESEMTTWINDRSPERCRARR